MIFQLFFILICIGETLLNLIVKTKKLPDTHLYRGDAY